MNKFDVFVMVLPLFGGFLKQQILEFVWFLILLVCFWKIWMAFICLFIKFC